MFQYERVEFGKVELSWLMKNWLSASSGNGATNKYYKINYHYHCIRRFLVDSQAFDTEAALALRCQLTAPDFKRAIAIIFSLCCSHFLIYYHVLRNKLLAPIYRRYSHLRAIFRQNPERLAFADGCARTMLDDETQIMKI